MEQSNYAVEGVPCRILCRLLQDDIKVKTKLKSFWSKHGRDPNHCFQMVTQVSLAHLIRDHTIVKTKQP